VLYRSVYQWIAKKLNDFKRHTMVGYAHPDGFLVALHYFGDFSTRFEDKRKRSRIGPLHHFEYGCIDSPGVLAHLAEVVAHERKVQLLLRFQPSDLAEPVYRFLVHQVAADTVNGVGGVYNESAARKNFDDMPDLALFGIDGMNFKKLRCHFV